VQATSVRLGYSTSWSASSYVSRVGISQWRCILSPRLSLRSLKLFITSSRCVSTLELTYDYDILRLSLYQPFINFTLPSPLPDEGRRRTHHSMEQRIRTDRAPVL